MKTAAERDVYIQRRLQQILWWNRLGWLVVVAIAAAAYWVNQHAPLLLNPAQVIARANTHHLPNADVVQLAALGNLAFAGCLMLMVGLVVYAYIAANSERRLIHLLSQSFDSVPPITSSSLSKIAESDHAPE
jgi:hypothetical protein